MNNALPRISTIALCSLAAAALTYGCLSYSSSDLGSPLQSEAAAQDSAEVDQFPADPVVRTLPASTPPAANQAPRNPAPTSPAPRGDVPSDQLQVRLIKNALITLNNANVTGNYTVLRDMCSPELREKKTAADFALTFRSTADPSRDMSLIMEMKPTQTHDPTLTADGRMRLVGYFPTEPLVLHYELTFRRTKHNGWWIEGIALATQSTRTQASPAVQPPAQRSDRVSRLPRINTPSNYMRRTLN